MAVPADLAASLLEIERDRLLCSVQHLERSVKELKEALKEDPDPEYKTAISENLVAIAKQRARVACLEDEIKRAKGIKADISHAQVAAIPVVDASAPGQLQPAQHQPHPSQPQQQQPQHASNQAADMEVDTTEAAPTGGTAAMHVGEQQRVSQAAASTNGNGGGGVWL